MDWDEEGFAEAAVDFGRDFYEFRHSGKVSPVPEHAVRIAFAMREIEKAKENLGEIRLSHPGDEIRAIGPLRLISEEAHQRISSVALEFDDCESPFFIISAQMIISSILSLIYGYDDHDAIVMEDLASVSCSVSLFDLGGMKPEQKGNLSLEFGFDISRHDDPESRNVRAILSEADEGRARIEVTREIERIHLSKTSVGDK